MPVCVVVVVWVGGWVGACAAAVPKLHSRINLFNTPGVSTWQVLCVALLPAASPHHPHVPGEAAGWGWGGRVM